jgi:hypothetical protein
MKRLKKRIGTVQCINTEKAYNQITKQKLYYSRTPGAPGQEMSVLWFK